MSSRAPALHARIAATILLGMLCASALAHEANASCQGGAQSAAILDARTTLEKNPGVLDPRVKLADALIAGGCFDEAVHVLEEGEPLHSRSTEFQAKLRNARSMLSEQKYFEGLERAEAAAKVSRNLLRCNRLGDLKACDDALSLQPDDPQILTAKADALVQAKRPAEALGVYRRAAELAPDNADIAAKIGAAQSQRLAFFAACQSANGEAALQACQAALLRGADDEFAIHKRKAILLQAANQPSPALDSYIAANLLKRDDRSVALAIVALSDSTGRKDALTLAARGSALLTLGRAIESLSPLRQALVLAPGLTEVRAQLVTAERLAQVEAREKALTAAASPQGPIASAAQGGAVTGNEQPSRRYSNAAPPTRTN